MVAKGGDRSFRLAADIRQTLTHERIGARRIDAHINSGRSYQPSLTRTVTRRVDRKEFRDNYETRLVPSILSAPLFPLRFYLSFAPGQDDDVDDDAGINLLV